MIFGLFFGSSFSEENKICAGKGEEERGGGREDVVCFQLLVCGAKCAEANFFSFLSLPPFSLFLKKKLGKSGVSWRGGEGRGGRGEEVV